jgi:hypothetical protein
MEQSEIIRALDQLEAGTLASHKCGLTMDLLVGTKSMMPKRSIG